MLGEAKNAEHKVRHTITNGLDENRKVSKRVNGRENEPDTKFICGNKL